MESDTRQKIIRILIFVLVVGLTIYLVLIRDRIADLEGYGYPGIFLFSLLANASLVIPLPGVILTSAMGAVFDPFWVAMAAGSGAALGEISGYLAGFSGRGLASRAGWYPRVEGWMRRYGIWAVLLLSFVPNPAFDIAGIVAGAMRMPLWKFLLFCWIGKILKMLVFAYGGAGLLDLLPF
ncbi:TVP38/TMEM64 family protein [Levilinea saccharolytica]|uniref:TVP38/TMEM64 family protein n=1 Tax=Levilinea saccharolytica TaxID=229921 RepID=UPI00078493DE|nr:VTT domain-containing protein [Levilinea saccharolytica]GAP18402.1 predicted membrane protein [Levilinea saccharolytica]